MKKVFALALTISLCAVMILPAFVHAQNQGLNPSRPASDAQASGEATDERYVIQFHQFSLDAAGTVRGAGGRVVRELPDLAAVAARLPEHVRVALQNSPLVKSIELDARRYPLQVNPPWSDVTTGGETKPYGIQMVQADQLTDINASNRKVCIIDSGYSINHEDLQDGSVTSSPDSGTGDPFVDNDGHGTHVAGTIAGMGGNSTGVVGVNPSSQLKLHIVKVFGDDGAWAYSSDLAGAVTQCRNAGSNVISMSLGGLFSSTIERNAFDSAYAAGVLSIAAAGNDGNTATNYPAGYSSVMSVAAVDNTEAHATFSNVNADVEISAPGVSVLSSVPYKEVNTLTVGATTLSGNHVEFAARSASGVTGTLVDGGICDTVGSWSGQVVLCQRGTVSFFDKVRNVQNGGGTAAVIYNNLPEPLFATLGAGNSSTIPAIGLSQADGAAAVALVGQSGTVVSNVEKPASGYANFNGTSMATPHVSGVAALVWSYNPTWTNAQIRNALTATARDKGTAGRDNTFGYGIVQAQSALTYLQTPPATPNAPTNLTGTPISRTQINLAWTDNSNNETGFRLERCQNATCTNFAQVVQTAANVTSYSNTGLKRNTTYRYRVRAYNAAGNSSYSNIVNVKTNN